MSIENTTCDYYTIVFLYSMRDDTGTLSFVVSGLVRPAMRIPLILSDELNVTCSLSVVLA
jgi:hypothetical protein